jgi:hypothetical protein
MYERDIVRERVMIHLKITYRVQTQSRGVVLLLFPSDITAYDSGKTAIAIKQSTYNVTFGRFRATIVAEDKK